MPNNPLLMLQEFGQSVWLDSISRRILRQALPLLIAQDGLRGVTSNPTIFEQAVAGSRDYDALIRKLAASGHDDHAIMEALVVEDIQQTCDLLRPVYDRLHGQDGFVSIEVSPRLAHQTQATLEEARRLWRLVNRPNLFVKIPGTAAGLPAIETAISDGINVNITLLFAVERYAEVVDAYFRGLERRVQAKQPIEHIHSVASFFVSRVDTVVDQQLEAAIQQASEPGKRKELEALFGQAAVANAKLAYRSFKTLCGSARFLKLTAAGANAQRVLWASTITKNPRYRDVVYVEELIGAHTVNTMPSATITAFRDHGRVRASLEEDVRGAEERLRHLQELGIDLARVTQSLEEDGVKKFRDSMDSLLREIAAKRELVTHRS